MKKLFPALMMSAALVLVVGCKTSPKREVANSQADVHSIPDFSYKLTDISTLGVTKEKLFEELDPTRIIKSGASICSNRALLWNWNMKRKYNVDSGKIFVFYSKGFFADQEYQDASGQYLEPGEQVEREWWYHVAPYVVENGKEYVLDGGFMGYRNPTPPGEITTPWKGKIDRPLTVNEWLLHFPKTTQCKEITADDKELTEHMRLGRAFPHPRDGGQARCYVRKIPMQYWTPLSVAMKELGKTASGVPTNPPFSRDNFWEGDLLSACEEAVSEDGIARFFGKGEKMKGCLQYLGLDGYLPAHVSLVPLQPWEKKLQKRKDRALRRLSRQ